MPKIAAPTVAEHHARQEQALLDCARRILLEAGPTAVTPAAVGAAAGLARSGVYKYFASGQDMLDRIVTDAFTAWGAQVREAVEAVPDPGAGIAAYVRTTLQLAASGVHRIAVLGGGMPHDDAARAKLRQAHRNLAEPLRAALAERGDQHPELTAELIDGALGRAIEQIDAGRPLDRVVAATLAFVLRALGISPSAHQM